ncbi:MULTISPECIES: SCO family protein [unclassified Kaistella]|uniref:SCO family protein n=1 Tax=unclassified Kaistella TaxID=2762626 RepID=UPI0027338C82|nr:MULTISPECIES: SCO family protein [unclassified Kaistella]MDP2454282.1 SCO family protein [Kaistella sp. SH11-4b]MDP2457647.1 SCO family protein [Kaistella sp. SH40-3]MDP2460405.1 SCO family protein [Kaistella sp. SH19-2b]
MKNFFIILISALFLFSCKENTEKQAEPKKSENGSIFVLDSKWQNQDGKELQLKELKGKNLVVVMIFTSCTTACPILVADMQKIESKIDPKKLKETTMVLVSIDPENDTPEVLKAYAQQRNIYGEPWLFLRSDKESVRELANVLAVKYKKISPIVFSHSNIISVFNKNGEMVNQVEGTVKSEDVANTVNGLN